MAENERSQSAAVNVNVKCKFIQHILVKKNL